MVLATVFFDRNRGGKNSTGKWVTVIKGKTASAIYDHPDERTAREAIGLKGGSRDPNVHPPHGETGFEQIEIDDGAVDLHT
jgi:hypothetical protein